jgi:hypothetical protein
LIDNATSLTSGTFQTITAGSNTAVTSQIVEIAASNVISFTDTGDGADIETKIMAAAGTIATGSYTFVLYSGTNAGIYDVAVTSANIAAAADFSVELVGVLSNVGLDALTSSNFY